MSYSPIRASGMVMMAVGLAMVMATVIIALLTEDPMPVAFGAIGIVFIGVGSRRVRRP